MKLGIIELLAVSLFSNVKYRSSICTPRLAHNLLQQNSCNHESFSQHAVIVFFYKAKQFCCLCRRSISSCLSSILNWVPAVCNTGQNTSNIATGPLQISYTLVSQQLPPQKATSRSQCTRHRKQGWQLGNTYHSLALNTMSCRWWTLGYWKVCCCASQLLRAELSQAGLLPYLNYEGCP